MVKKGSHLSEEAKAKLSATNLGEKSHMWKRGISNGEYSWEFDEPMREMIRDKYGRKCFNCGEPGDGKKLDVHHVDYNKKQGSENHPWILVPLCRSCHTKTNHKRDVWEEKIKLKMEKHGHKNN